MLPKEITDFIGRRGGVRGMEVEKGAIKRFAEAVGNMNPLYWDEEYARNSKYGAIISIPGFFGWQVRGSHDPGFVEPSVELTSALMKAGFTGRWINTINNNYC